MKRTSLWEIKESTNGITMQIDASWVCTRVWNASDLDGMATKARYNPMRVNGSAVVRRRGYP